MGTTIQQAQWPVDWSGALLAQPSMAYEWLSGTKMVNKTNTTDKDVINYITVVSHTTENYKSMQKISMTCSAPYYCRK